MSKCSVIGCGCKSRSIGLCAKHYMRYLRHKSPTIVKYNKDGVNIRKKYLHEYYSYTDMKTRCKYKSHKQYKDYGGRGIQICKRWLLPCGEGFKNFLKDMGPRPSKEYTLDRIDVNGNYEPLNCRWATRKEQAANRRPLL